MSLYLTHYSHRKKRTGQAQYDLNADTNPLTDSQHGADMCVHIDTQSQDGDSLVNEDAPVVEKFELREREMETSTELAKQLDHQESSHSSVDQKQDLHVPCLNSPVIVNDSQHPPLPDTQGATGLQEASDDTSAAEEVEMKVLGDDQNDQARTSGDQRQDISLVHTPVTFSADSQQPPLPDTQGVTGLQETSDDTSAAEEVELKVLGDDEEEEQASSDKDATLHCTRASGDHGDTGEQIEMSEMHNLETEKHKPFEYQKL